MDQQYNAYSIIQNRDSIIQTLHDKNNAGELYIITHNDIDGMAAKLIATSCFSSINIITIEGAAKLEEQVLSVINNNKNFIIIVDIEVNDKTAEIIAQNKNVLVFDHHQKSKILTSLNSIINPAHCASFLFYTYLLPKFPDLKRYAKLMEFIDDIDIPLNKIPEAEHVNSLYDFKGERYCLARFKRNPSPILTKQEIIALSDESARKTQHMRNNINRYMVIGKDINNDIYAEIELQHNTREIVQLIFENNPDVSYAIVYSPNSRKYAHLPGFENGFARIILNNKHQNILYEIAKLYTDEVRGGKINMTYYPIDTKRYIEYLNKLDQINS